MRKRVTIKDVAKEAGVSIATISYVINKKGRVKKETEERVKAIIKRMNYIPDISARSLVNKNSRLLGVVIPQTEKDKQIMLNNPFYSEFISGVEYYARENNFQVIVSGSDINEKYLDMAVERNMNGIIVLGMYPDEFYSELKKSDIPIVLVDSYCNDHYYHSVQINDRYGAYIGTKYLIEKGHKNIGILTGKIKSKGVVEQRFLGYMDALKEFDLPILLENVYEGIVNFDFGISMAKRVASNKKMTAVFASADILALGLIKGLNGEGVNVPEDISIMGFDNIYISEIFNPGLTTVRQNIYKKGEKAVEILMDNLLNDNKSKQEVVLPIDIIERETVKQINI